MPGLAGQPQSYSGVTNKVTGNRVLRWSLWLLYIHTGTTYSYLL
jgi:hypothetical protein